MLRMLRHRVELLGRRLLMPEQPIHKHPRYVAALWYSWGQIDAGIGRHCDPFKFAQWHAEDAQSYDAGRVSFLSSIIDAWKTYREQVTP